MDHRARQGCPRPPARGALAWHGGQPHAGRDTLRFLRTYFQRPLRDILRDEARLLAHMEREANRLQERYLRKYAKGAS